MNWETSLELAVVTGFWLRWYGGSRDEIFILNAETLHINPLSSSSKNWEPGFKLPENRLQQTVDFPGMDPSSSPHSKDPSSNIRLSFKVKYRHFQLFQLEGLSMLDFLSKFMEVLLPSRAMKWTMREDKRSNKKAMPEKERTPRRVEKGWGPKDERRAAILKRFLQSYDFPRKSNVFYAKEQFGDDSGVQCNTKPIKKITQLQTKQKKGRKESVVPVYFIAQLWEMIAWPPQCRQWCEI